MVKMKTEVCSVCKRIINNGEIVFKTPNIFFMLSDSKYLCGEKCMNIFKINTLEIEQGVSRLQNMVEWG